MLSKKNFKYQSDRPLKFPHLSQSIGQKDNGVSRSRDSFSALVDVTANCSQTSEVASATLPRLFSLQCLMQASSVDLFGINVMLKNGAVATIGREAQCCLRMTQPSLCCGNGVGNQGQIL